MNIKEYIDEMPDDVLTDAMKSIHASHGDDAFFVADDEDGIVPYEWIHDVKITNLQVRITVLVRLGKGDGLLKEVYLPLGGEGERYIKGFIARIKP